VRTKADVVVRGNHDKACTGTNDVEWFNPIARSAALWTLAQLTPENVAYTHDLPKGPLLIDNFELMHGAPFDEDEYVVAGQSAVEAFQYLERRVGFFGHTHVQGGFLWNEARVELLGRPAPRSRRERLDLDPLCAYLVNPGSVGQPRDGDPRAAYATFDSTANRVYYHRVVYDVEQAQDKILQAGLPPALADRLSLGR
jgi:diadenosine tetraphosphatase ApaH/serine/threonine PP2A family protein phosphatase